jgi:hypothetical protein
VKERTAAYDAKTRIEAYIIEVMGAWKEWLWPGFAGTLFKFTVTIRSFVVVSFYFFLLFAIFSPYKLTSVYNDIWVAVLCYQWFSRSLTNSCICSTFFSSIDLL